MGDNTQERNHSYINIIEVIYKARETALVQPLLMKIKNAHTALSLLMKLFPHLAVENENLDGKGWKRLTLTTAPWLLIYTIPKDQNALRPTTDSSITYG